VAVFDTLAEAVAVLHRAGLIHRDIKPENVFLEDGPVPHPVLLDFGIARDVSESESTTTAAGQTRGTPAYMAPERFFGTVASVRTDVYELAVTLYAMLTARLPWDDVQSAATRLSPIPPAHVGVGLPPELVTVILRALSTRPEMRPESADSFADLVRRAATGAPLESGRTTAAIGVGSISAPATPAGSSIPPLMYDVHRARRRPRLAWAMGVGLVGVLAMFGAAVLAHPNRGTQALASEARVPSVNASQETAPSAPQPERQTIVPIPAPDAPPPAEKSRPAPAPAIAPAMAVSSAPRRLPPPPVTAAPTTTSPAESAARYYRDRK
jgi:serine/threonine-protein kinase